MGKKAEVTRADLGFHAKNGWHFKREEGGGVRIVQYAAGGKLLAETILDAGTWASIVAFVATPVGESTETAGAASE